MVLYYIYFPLLWEGVVGNGANNGEHVWGTMDCTEGIRGIFKEKSYIGKLSFQPMLILCTIESVNLRKIILARGLTPLKAEWF